MARICPEPRDIAALWPIGRKFLREAPPQAHIPGRKRSAAPPRLGRNRGSMGFVTATLSPQPKPSDDGSALHLLAAFVRALEEAYALDAIVVDHWFSDREADGGSSQVGAFDSFHPLVLPALPDHEAALEAALKRCRDQAHRHRSVDTPTLEREMQALLRERDIGLRQFGFAFLDAAQAAHTAPLQSPLDAVPLTPQEMQFAAACDICGIRVRFGVDLDVFSQADANRLFDEIMLNAQRLFDAADLQIADREWHAKEWPEIAAPGEEICRSALDDLPNVERELPVTRVHHHFISMADNPELSPLARSIFVIGKEFIVQPQMDMERLRKAIGTLVSRHEAIRLRFVRHAGDYLAYLEANPPVENYLLVEQVADEAAARERAQVLAYETIEPTEPLLRVTVVRFDKGDLIIAKAHHIVFDGYSLGLVMDEMVKAYVGLPLPAVEMDLDTYNRDFLLIGDTQFEALREAYFEEIYADPPPYPNIGRKAAGLEIDHFRENPGIAKEIFRVLEPDASRDLDVRAKAVGATASQMVMAAFAKAICVLGNVDEVLLEMVHAMRLDRRLDNFVNNLAGGFQLRVPASADMRLEDLAVDINERKNRALADGLIGNILKTPLHDKVIDAGSYASRFLTGDVTVNKWSQDTASAPMQRVNAQGDVSMGMYTITNLPPLKTELIAVYELILRSFVLEDGSLGMSFTYDEEGMKIEEANAFLDFVEAELRC